MALNKDEHINNPRDWWDLFHMVCKGITIDYSLRKAQVRKRFKTSVMQQLQRYEELDLDKFTPAQSIDFEYLKTVYTDLLKQEIDGHLVRTRFNPRYEINEPDIDFLSKLERRSAQKAIIAELVDDKGNYHTDTHNLLKVADEYYTKLFTPSKVNHGKQQYLLKNVNKTISREDRELLDKPLENKELEDVVNQLLRNKSPGLDGYTAEFYKKIWHLLKIVILPFLALKQTH